jgi:FPC/CPF motif-containing protein YcgG
MVMLVLLLLALGVSAAQQPARPSAQSLGTKLAREARQVRERDSEKSVAECV